MGTGPAAGSRWPAAGAAAGLTLAVALPALASTYWRSVFDVLVLDRDALLTGQFWRLWSGHLAHADAAHAGINITAFALLGLLAARLRTLPSLSVASLVMMPAISAGLLLALPDLHWYAGLSGLLHAWAAWLLLALGGWRALAGLSLLVAKLVAEQVPQTLDPALPAVVTEAHVLGVLIGTLAAIATTTVCARRHRQSSRE